MKRLLLSLALLLALATPLTAQTTWPPNLTFQVVADHAGSDTTGYRLLQDGKPIQIKPVTALVNGTITFPFPMGLTAGTYTFTVEAFNLVGAATSEPTTLIVTSDPPPPPPVVSPDKTTIPPASQIVDTGLHVWTIGSPNVILKDGVQWSNGLGSVLTWCGGVVRTLGIDGNWYDVTASGWNSIGKVDMCATAPPPPPPVDCVVSAWSCTTWSACEASGTQTRACSRSVLTPAANGGIACPALTQIETQPCAPPPPPPPPPADTQGPVLAITNIARSGNSNNYTVSATAVDQSGVLHVDVYVDGTLAARLFLPVYGSTYQAKVPIRTPGAHVVKVTAYDTPGNFTTVTRTVIR